MPRPKKQDAIPYHADILEMAIVGYEAAVMKIETEILAIKKALGAASLSYARTTTLPTEEPPKKRKMSAASRKRIAAAQKKRWDTGRESEDPD